jgi:hypothetical protein
VLLQEKERSDKAKAAADKARKKEKEKEGGSGKDTEGAKVGSRGGCVCTHTCVLGVCETRCLL